MATIQDAINYGTMIICPFWELSELSGNSLNRIFQNPDFKNESAPDLQASLDALKQAVEFYSQAKPDASYSVTFRRTKTSNGAGVYAPFRFSKEGNETPTGTAIAVPAAPIQAYSPAMDTIWEARLSLSEEKNKFNTEKLLWEAEKKRDDEKRAEFEAKLKDLELKYNDKVEYAKEGAGKAIGKLLEGFLGTPEKQERGGGVGEIQKENDAPLTPQEEIISEIAEYINAKNFEVRPLQQVKSMVIKFTDSVEAEINSAKNE